MRWLCPQCRRAISFAFTECPFCLKAAAARPPEETASSAATSRTSSTAAGQALSASLPVPRKSAVVIRQLVLSPSPLAPARTGEPPESRFTSGFRFGIGFALALVAIVLLLLGFWLWLSRP